MKSVLSPGTAERASPACHLRYPSRRVGPVAAKLLFTLSPKAYDACCLFAICMKRASTAPGVGSDPLGPVEGTMGREARALDPAPRSRLFILRHPLEFVVGADV